ncbi:hypothetical protein [Parasphingopyxis sp.]|uniref:hypothetical protein n=1 Tax=Parasphingopyxis sp. TaxID=1920299 RepID=UPI00261D536F|nr:hypothetical protein [Parasphingopyxis sp.]
MEDVMQRRACILFQRDIFSSDDDRRLIARQIFFGQECRLAPRIPIEPDEMECICTFIVTVHQYCGIIQR